jgi:hypothetical protein
MATIPNRSVASFGWAGFLVTALYGSGSVRAPDRRTIRRTPSDWMGARISAGPDGRKAAVLWRPSVSVSNPRGLCEPSAIPFELSCRGAVGRAMRKRGFVLSYVAAVDYCTQGDLMPRSFAKWQRGESVRRTIAGKRVSERRNLRTLGDGERI